MADRFENGSLAAAMTGPVGEVAVHSHCHAKALSDQKTVLSVLERLPGASPRLLDTGCCGMAGAFGMLKEHRGLSHEVAQPLVAAIEVLPRDTAMVASGTSCRHQIEDAVAGNARHVACLLRDALA